jgi:ribosomal protein S18 acetylase RimI-like enzyme
MAGDVRPYDPAADEPWAVEFLDDHLGGRWQARRGELIDVLAPGFGLVAPGGVGLLTWRPDGDAIELTAIATDPTGHGTGTALVEALAAVARERGVGRIAVVTTNDNLDALAFYERRGFTVADIRVGAVDEARRTIKPAIPVVGQHGIEMHDEIELERVLLGADLSRAP